ncbi:MAG: phenylalanine--tRNA ligase subunit beta [Candidatus Woesearchaeota archaeon]
MVKIDISYKQLQQLVGKSFSVQELEMVLFDLGMELDGVQQDTLTIDITSERCDMVSLYGLARVLKAYWGIAISTYSAQPSSYVVEVTSHVEHVRPYTMCAVVQHLDFSEQQLKEVIAVQEKIHATFGRNRKKVAIGIYPMEHIAFPVTFDAKSDISFRPLDGPTVMSAQDILQTTPTGKQYGHLLNNNVYPYFIDAQQRILSMPPIINSYESGRVTTTTKDIFIECSGHDKEALSKMLNMLVYMFADMGGTIQQVTMQYPQQTFTTPLLAPQVRTLSLQAIEAVTGLGLDTKTYASLLQKMMYSNIQVTDTDLTFEVPCIRTDIWHDIDVIDDIVRAYGVNNIPIQLPQSSTYASVLPSQELKQHISNHMIGLGFTQVCTLLLTDSKDQYNKMDIDVQDHMKLGYSAEQHINMVRTWLTPELLKVIMYNRQKSLPLSIFECNEVVVPDASKDVLSRTALHVGGLLCDKQVTFTYMKSVVQSVMQALNKEVTYQPSTLSCYIQGRCADILYDGQVVGHVGEIHPKVLDAWQISYPIVSFELDCALFLK